MTADIYLLVEVQGAMKVANQQASKTQVRCVFYFDSRHYRQGH